MFITPDAKHIVLPASEALTNLLPHGRPLRWNGADYLVVPNGRDEAKLARNLGLPVPSPILTAYGWRGLKPWDVQRTTAMLLSEHPRFFLLSSMGTGKTRSAIFAADWLMEQHKAERVLVVAPLSTLSPVWERELFHVMPREKVTILHADREKRFKLLKDGARWFIINHHGVALMKDALIARGFDIIIIDELAIFRNRSTRLWAGINDLVQAPGTKYAWGLTGSPTPKAPTDAWAQVRMLAPTRVPRTFALFRDMTMRRISQFRWLNRPGATAIVHRAMQPSVRYSRDDIEELPPTSVVDRSVEMTPSAKRLYVALIQRLRVMYAEGAVTAANEGILQGKLLQIACGWVYTDKKGVIELDNAGRLAALEEVLAETERNVLVFVPFVHALKGVAEHLKQAGESIAVVYGDTPRGQRDLIFAKFQEGKGPRIIVAHPQTMAHGLNLTSADTIVWFSPTMSLEIYEQANARITRPGQKHKTLIVHLTGTPVEEATYARLRSRSRMQGLLLTYFHDQELPL